MSRFSILICLVAVLFSCRAKQVTGQQEKPKQEAKKAEPQQKKDTGTAQKAATSSGPYNFLLFLPAGLSEIFVPDTVSPDSVVMKENFSKDFIDAVNFYEGALLAADSLRKAGNDIQLKVVDLPASEDLQRTKLWVQKYDNVNIVFSMVKGKPLKTLSDILAVRKIPLISCEANTYSFVEKNPQAVCVQPSSLTQCRMMGAFAGKRFKNDNFIILSSNSDKEQERSAAFTEGLGDSIMVSRVKKITFFQGDTLAVTKVLSAAYTNTLFIPSTDEDFVTSIYSLLESYAGVYRFRIIGLPVWQYFETLDIRLLEKYNTVLFASEYFTYDDKDVLLFRKKFRDHFSTEPAEGAYLGYDSFLQFSNLLLNKRLPIDTPELNLKGLRGTYYFKGKAAAAAENSYINILKIENFRYVKLNEN